MLGAPCIDGRWRRQVQQDTKEVWRLGCRMVLHFVQGRGLGLEGVPGSLCCVPRAGDSHKVDGEFAEDQFQLLMHWFPLDTCQDRMWHLDLDTVGGHSIGHGCSIWEDLTAQRGGVLYVPMVTLMTPIIRAAMTPNQFWA
jgi:hypothetical protein